jgi:hypothetical protein
MSISKLNYNEKQCTESAQKGAQFFGLPENFSFDCDIFSRFCHLDFNF